MSFDRALQGLLAGVARRCNRRLVEFRLDGNLVYAQSLPPSGIWADGKATVYQRLRINAGEHELSVAMNHSGGESGFEFEKTIRRDLAPGDNLVIGFDELQRQFVLR